MKRLLAIALAMPVLLRCAAPEAGPSWTRGLPQDPSFFPIGVWLQDPAAAPRYRDLGINLYVGLSKIPEGGHLDALRQAGMRLILRADEAGLCFKGDPAVAAWMQEDEPDSAQLLGPCKGYGPPIPPGEVSREYERIRSADPSRPILLNLGPGAAWDAYPARGTRRMRPDDYPEYARGGDVLSFSFYPVNRDEAQVAGKLEFVALGVDRLRAAGGGRRPVWAFVETTPIRDEARRPSPRIVRAEVWMALVHGARGIVYFAHRFRPRFDEAGLLSDAEMAAAVAAINRQVLDLAPALNGPSVEGAGVASEVPIDAVAKRRDGATYVFAVAMRNAAARGTFTVPGLKGRAPVEVIGEGRSIEAVDGVFADEFEGYGVHLYRIGDGPYEKRADMPHPVFGHAGAVSGGKVHALGGSPTADWARPCKRHQVYDPAADAWSAAADLPVEVVWPMPAVHGGRIYLFGGLGDGARATRKAHVYDPAADKWSPIRDLPQPVMKGVARAFGDSIYVGLGCDRTGPAVGRKGAADVPEQHLATWRYDPAADTYARVADAPEYGIFCVAGAYRDSIYVIPGAAVETGFHGAEDFVLAEGALKYTPAADRWTKIQAPRVCRRTPCLTQNSSAVSHGEKLFVIGGWGENRGRTTVAEYFDMAREVFRLMPPIPDQRSCGGAGVVGDLLVLPGGFYGPSNKDGPCRATWLFRCK